MDWGFWIEEEELFVFKKDDGKTLSHMKLQWEIVVGSGKWIKLKAFTEKLSYYYTVIGPTIQ